MFVVRYQRTCLSGVFVRVYAVYFYISIIGITRVHAWVFCFKTSLCPFIEKYRGMNDEFSLSNSFSASFHAYTDIFQEH